MKSSSLSRCYGGIFDWDQAIKRLDYLNHKAEDPSLWNNPQDAQKLMRERQFLDESINGLRAIETAISDNCELIELGEDEGDEEERWAQGHDIHTAHRLLLLTPQLPGDECWGQRTGTGSSTFIY